MKKTIVCTMIGGLVLMFGLSNYIFGQFTITANDAPKDIGTFLEFGADSALVPINLGESGANQYWDFSNIQLPIKEYWRIIDPKKSPHGHRVPEANIVFEITRENDHRIEYYYDQLTDSALTRLAMGNVTITGTDTTKNAVVFKRVTPMLNLPASYGVTPEWPTIFEIDTTYIVFNVTVVDSYQNKIDAWGTLKTAMGEFQCLRILQIHDRTVYSAGGGKLATLEKDIRYSWITKKFGIIATVVSMNEETNLNFSMADSIAILTKDLTSIQDVVNGEILQEFVLFQNYPNPFNPKTTISYQLNETSDVTLKVFNLYGQEVALLVRQRQQPGRYEFEWNASHLPSGVYYYQVQANQNLLTQKCLLLK